MSFVVGDLVTTTRRSDDVWGGLDGVIVGYDSIVGTFYVVLDDPTATSQKYWPRGVPFAASELVLRRSVSDWVEALPDDESTWPTGDDLVLYTAGQDEMTVADVRCAEAVRRVRSEVSEVWRVFWKPFAPPPVWGWP